MVTVSPSLTNELHSGLTMAQTGDWFFSQPVREKINRYSTRTSRKIIPFVFIAGENNVQHPIAGPPDRKGHVSVLNEWEMQGCVSVSRGTHIWENTGTS
jgi:hypothetical protein